MKIEFNRKLIHQNFSPKCSPFFLTAFSLAFVSTPFNTSYGQDLNSNIEEEKKNIYTLEEVIVTASKRESNIQDTAMSISALTGDTIDKRGFVGMSDYLLALPNVSMQERGAGRNSVVIRGIASDPEAEISAVGIYFGDTPVTGLGSSASGDSSGNADIKLVDIERVEVLRGPQGTLYGSGSMGGTVRVIPRSPNLEEVEGTLAGRYSETEGYGSDNSMFQAVLNIPLIEDTLAMRAVAYKFSNSGYIKNVATTPSEQQFNIAAAIARSGVTHNQDDIGSDEYTGFRLATLWQPNDQFDVTLSYIDQDIEQSGFPEIDTDLDGGFEQMRLKTGPGGTRTEVMGNELHISNLQANFDMGWAVLSSSSSWIEYNGNSENDMSRFLGGIEIYGPTYQTRETMDEAVIEELRLTSQFDGPLQFLMGLYYEDRESEQSIQWFWSGDINLVDPQYALTDIHLNLVNKQQALFGELTYELTEQLALTVGARHFDYEQYLDAYVDGAYADKEESDKSYKVNISYRSDSGLLAFGQWAEGFRLGQAALTTNVTPSCDANSDGILDDVGFADPGPLGPDTLENYELGIKVPLADNRVTVNASVYRINWEGIPVGIILPSCANIIRLNAGNSKSEGIELELKTFLTENMQLDVNASYGESVLTADAENLGKKGDNLPGSADFNFGLSMEYNFVLAGYDAFVRGDYAYTGEYYNNVAEIGEPAGGYSQINLKTGIAFDSMKLDLFVNNLTNEDDFTWVESTLADLGLAAPSAYRLRPRTVGLNINYQF